MSRFPWPAGIKTEEDGAGCAKRHRPQHGPCRRKGGHRKQRANDSADAEAERPRQGGCGSRHVRELIQNHRHRIGRHHRHAADKGRYADHQRPEAHAQKRAHHQPDRHHKLDPQPRAKHVQRPHPPDKAAVDDGHDEQEDDIKRKVIAEVLRRHVVKLDVDKRPGAQEREHSGKAEPACQHIAEHALVAKQRGKVADGSTDVGNVSYEIPTAQPTLSIGSGLEAHTPEFACAAGSDFGFEQAIKGAKIMAITALRFAHYCVNTNTK